MNYPKGIRVGAILDMNQDEGWVRLLGYGTYEGDECPVIDGEEFPMENPKIVLDNGKVVWGMECWWGPEDEIKQQLAGLKVTEIDIDDARFENRSERN